MCGAEGRRIQEGHGQGSGRPGAACRTFRDGFLGLLREAAEFKGNKLLAAEYDGETTWSARTWMTFAMQRISVPIHKAVAKELSEALGFSAAVD